MSVDPSIMMKALAQAKNQQVNSPAQSAALQNAQIPGQVAMSMGNAPSGTNTGAGATNAMAKLALAMMQRKRMQDYQRQYGQPQVPTQGQGQTLSGPVDNSSAPVGMMGPP